MAVSYSPCLLGAMDRLWFHQIIIFSEPISLICSNSSLSSSISCQSTKASRPATKLGEAISPASSIISIPQDYNSNEEDHDEQEKAHEENKERHIKQDPTNYRSTHPRSSSQSTESRPRSLSDDRPNPSGQRLLHGAMSCKNLYELELEEVKGFTDLGFTFDEKQLTPRMMSLIPGLQRLGGPKNETKTDLSYAKDVKDGEEEEAESRSEARRPYLSEAWLISKPNSPLLKLRMSRASTTDDMKKHLKIWAKTVASVLQHES